MTSAAYDCPSSRVAAGGGGLGQRLGEPPAQRRVRSCATVPDRYSTGSDFKRPTPQVVVRRGEPTARMARTLPIRLSLPGKGQPRQRRAGGGRGGAAPIRRHGGRAVSTVDEVAGRYQTVPWDTTA